MNQAVRSLRPDERLAIPEILADIKAEKASVHEQLQATKEARKVSRNIEQEADKCNDLTKLEVHHLNLTVLQKVLVAAAAAARQTDDVTGWPFEECCK